MKSPYQIGESFDLPIAVVKMALEASEGSNYRADAEEQLELGTFAQQKLAELAMSIRDNGLLQPVLMYWTGEDYRIAAGFRRARAMVIHAGPYGFELMPCRLVDGERADLIRLAENVDRDDPSSYSTISNMARLAAGDPRANPPRPPRRPREIADAIGMSVSHVRNMLRVHAALPENVLKAWRNDKTGRFTFRALTELAAARVTEERRAEIVAQLLGARSPATSKSAPGASGGDDGDGGDDGEPEAEPSTGRKLGRVGAKKLLGELEAVGDRIDSDDRAPLVRDLLRAMAGEAPASLASDIVRRIVADLGGAPRSMAVRPKLAAAGG